MKFLALDIETTGLTWKDDILTIGAAWDGSEGINSTAWTVGMVDLFNQPHPIPLLISILRKLCREADVIAMHNTTFDLTYLVNNQFLTIADVKGKLFDTLLTARMTGPRDRVSLEHLCESYKISDDGWSAFKAKRKNLSTLDVSSVLEYNAIDAKNTLLLAKELWGESISLYGEEFTRRESDFCRLMTEVRLRGKKINREGTTVHYRQLQQERRELLKYTIWPAGIKGPNDRTEIIKWLRIKGFSNTKFNYTEKGNERLDKDSLEEMAEKATGEVKKVLEAIVRVRHIEKLCGTYVVPYLEDFADENDYVHSNYTVAGAYTHRLSSSNPNAQNVPRELSNILWDRYLSADYSQAELRIAAAYAQEMNLANAFAEGKDIHDETALAMFGTLKERPTAKNTNFAILYGGGASTLEQRYKIPFERGIKFIRKHRQIYPNLHTATKLAEKTWREKGYLKLLSGKRLWATQDDLRRAYKAFNNLIQGGVGELAKEAMLRLDEKGIKIIGQIHDSIEFNLCERDREEEIQDTMESVLPEWLSNRTDPSIQMKVDMEIKGDAKDVG